jgi:hypothetical protein
MTGCSLRANRYRRTGVTELRTLDFEASSRPRAPLVLCHGLPGASCEEPEPCYGAFREYDASAGAVGVCCWSHPTARCCLHLDLVELCNARDLRRRL